MKLPSPDAPVVLVHRTSGEQVGPFSRRALAAKVAGGDLSVTDHFWFDGADGWTVISAHPELLDDLDTTATPPAEKRAPDESDDDFHDRVFGQLVQASWDWHDDHAYANHVDEVFLGAIITSTLDTGYSLIDLTSDGVHHYLRFEKLGEGSRIIIRLTHLTGSLSLAKILGHKASVVVGYGEKVANAGTVLQAIKAEFKSAMVVDNEPGTISVDGDLASGYVYVQVDLTWSIDDYVSRTYQTDNQRLSLHIAATTHALRKYLRGRFL